MTLEPRLPPCLAATEPCGGPGFTGCPVAWLGTVNDPCLAATEVTVRTSLTQGLPAAFHAPNRAGGVLGRSWTEPLATAGLELRADAGRERGRVRPSCPVAAHCRPSFPLLQIRSTRSFRGPGGPRSSPLVPPVREGSGGGQVGRAQRWGVCAHGSTPPA